MLLILLLLLLLLLWLWLSSRRGAADLAPTPLPHRAAAAASREAASRGAQGATRAAGAGRGVAHHPIVMYYAQLVLPPNIVGLLDDIQRSIVALLLLLAWALSAYLFRRIWRDRD